MDSRAGRPDDEAWAVTLVKWIPVEAITLYTGILAAGAAQAELTGKETDRQLLQRVHTGHWSWFVFALGIAALAVFVVAWLKHKAPGDIHLRSLGLRVAFAMVAFAVWTTLQPGSWSHGLPLVQDMGMVYPLAVAAVVITFSAAGEKLLTQVEGKKDSTVNQLLERRGSEGGRATEREHE